MQTLFFFANENTGIKVRSSKHDAEKIGVMQKRRNDFYKSYH